MKKLMFFIVAMLFVSTAFAQTDPIALIQGAETRGVVSVEYIAVQLNSEIDYANFGTGTGQWNWSTIFGDFTIIDGSTNIVPIGINTVGVTEANWFNIEFDTGAYPFDPDKNDLFLDYQRTTTPIPCVNGANVQNPASPVSIWDRIAPTLTVDDTYSNHSGAPKLSVKGDIITVDFSSNENLTTSPFPLVQVFADGDTPCTANATQNPNQQNWKAEIEISNLSHTEGYIYVKITCKDVNNNSQTKEHTSDVMYKDSTPLVVYVKDIWDGQPAVVAVNPLQIWQWDAFQTIAGGMNGVVASGIGIVNVLTGTYTGDVVIDKALTLQSVSGKEVTFIDPGADGQGAIEISVDNVTVDGFTIKGGTQATSAANPAEHVIWVHAEYSTIKNNAILIDRGNTAGIYIGGRTANTPPTAIWGYQVSTPRGHTIQDNIIRSKFCGEGWGIFAYDLSDDCLIKGNQIHGDLDDIGNWSTANEGAPGTGIIIHQASKGSGTNAVIVENNTAEYIKYSWLTFNVLYPFNQAPSDVSPGAFYEFAEDATVDDVVVQNNTVHDCGQDVDHSSGVGVTFQSDKKTYYGSPSADLTIGTGNVTVQNNTFYENEYGVRIKGPKEYLGTYGCVLQAENIIVLNNQIYDNESYGLYNGTIELNQDDGPKLITATDNWWGSENGPDHIDNTFNVTAQGDVSSDFVDYVPWYDANIAGTSFWPVEMTGSLKFSSIQTAIDAAAGTGGETITCKAGTFTEDVTVDKFVTVNGANDGINPITGTRGDESIIDGGFLITVNDITIDGFTIENGRPSVAAPAESAAIVVEGNSDGHILTNNILIGPNLHQTFGINLFKWSDNVTIDGNKSSLWEHGIYLRSECSAVTVNDNEVYDNIKCGIAVSYSTGCFVTYNKVYGNNTMKAPGGQGGIVVWQGSDHSIEYNEVYGNFIGGIDLGAATDCVVTNNDIHDNNPDVHADGAGVVVYQGSGHLVNNNKIYGNGIYGFARTGNTVVIDATKNWWGSFYGPYHADNPWNSEVTIGNAVTNYVDFMPWYSTIGFDEDVLVYNTTVATSLCYAHTIQDGIDLAITNWDIVGVSPGDYTEYLVVDKSLTIHSFEGAASTTVQPPADALAAFNVTATGATIGGTGFGFTISPGGRGGIYADITGGNGITVQDNIFKSYGDGESRGMWFDGLSNSALIDNNSFATPKLGTGIQVVNAGGTASIISNNTVDTGTLKYCFLTFKAEAFYPERHPGMPYAEYVSENPSTIENISITGNSVTGMEANRVAIMFATSTKGADHGEPQAQDLAIGENVDITQNLFSTNGYGFGIEADEAAEDDPSQIAHITGVDNISLTTNNFTGNTTAVYNGQTTLLDAENNWWGTSSGPSHAGNTYTNLAAEPQGDEVTDNVTYVPWWNGIYPAGSSFWPVEMTGSLKFSSIQTAIDAASAGHTITCANGTFSEAINVNKGVIIKSAGATSIVPNTADLAAFNVTAIGATIGGTGFGFTISPGGRGGIYADIIGGDGITVQGNTFKSYGDGESRGMWFDGLSNSALIDNNSFATPKLGTGIQVVNAGGTASIISNNTVDTGTLKYCFLTFKAEAFYPERHPGMPYAEYVAENPSTIENINITDNNIVGVDTDRWGVRIAASTKSAEHGQPQAQDLTIGTGVSFTGNTFNTVDAIGLMIDADKVKDGQIAHILTVNNLTITGNAFDSNAKGIDNGQPTTVNATNNWWGHATGPSFTYLDIGIDPLTGFNYGSGSGDEITDYVDYLPWWNTSTGGSYPATVSQYIMSITPASPIENTYFDITIYAADEFGTINPDYGNVVDFSQSHAALTVPDPQLLVNGFKEITDGCISTEVFASVDNLEIYAWEYATNPNPLYYSKLSNIVIQAAGAPEPPTVTSVSDVPDDNGGLIYLDYTISTDDPFYVGPAEGGNVKISQSEANGNVRNAQYTVSGPTDNYGVSYYIVERDAGTTIGGEDWVFVATIGAYDNGLTGNAYRAQLNAPTTDIAYDYKMASVYNPAGDLTRTKNEPIISYEPREPTDDGSQSAWVDCGAAAAADDLPAYANFTVFLEGPYQADGTMTNDLNGLPELAGAPENAVDVITVELRTTATGATVKTAGAYIATDGSIINASGEESLPFYYTTGIEYYIVIHHRNHLDIMSSENWTFADWPYETAPNINLSLINSSYLNGFKLVEPGRYAMYSGDADANGEVNPVDRNNYWRLQTGTAGYKSADFDLNGEVNPIDRNNYWRLNTGIGTSVPTQDGDDSQKTKAPVYITGSTRGDRDTGITFTFDNGVVSGGYYEFDVMAYASSEGTKIGTGIVYINYNTAGFGEHIFGSENVTVTKGTLTTTAGPPLYNVIPNDNTSSRLAVTFEYTSAAGWGNALPTTATDLIHVKIDIANASATAGLGFQQSLMTGNQFYDDNATIYNPVTAIDTCDPTLPVILSSFTTAYIEDTPVILWTTQSEDGNAGWNLYRGDTEEAFTNDEAIMINPELIEGAGTTSEPTDYTFEDVFPVFQETTYFYCLESVDYSGESEIYGPISLTIPEDEWENPNSPEIPKNYGLRQNYPNPFNPITEISFMMKEYCIAELSVYNIKGEKVSTLFQNKSVAKDELIRTNWNGKDDFGKAVSSGIYFYKLRTTKGNFVRKMILVK